MFLRLGSPAVMSSACLNIGLFCCVSNQSLLIEPGMSQAMQTATKIITIVITSQTRGSHENAGVFTGFFRKSQLPIHSKMCETCSMTPEVCWICLVAKDLKYGSNEADCPRIAHFN